MIKHTALATALAASSLLAGGYSAVSAGESQAARVISFPDARLKIEYNATDGDAGLQVFLDAPAWRHISITNPAGNPLLDVEAEQVIRNYGLTELFSESSEPPFDEFPFEDFKRLFPEGRYAFKGTTVDGEHMRSVFVLSHDVPDGPVIASPVEGSVNPADDVTVVWDPVTTPTGVEVVGYQVLVVADAPSLGNPKRVLDVMLPATADSFAVPAEFLLAGTYKAEVLAIERGGNQTLSEVAFEVG